MRCRPRAQFALLAIWHFASTLPGASTTQGNGDSVTAVAPFTANDQSQFKEVSPQPGPNAGGFRLFAPDLSRCGGGVH